MKTTGKAVLEEDQRLSTHAVQALQESETRLQALVGSIDEIVFEFDRDGTYLHIWTTNDNLLARPRHELLGHRATDVLGEEFARPFVDSFRRVLMTGQSETVEYPLDLPTGKNWFLARVSPIPSHHGAPPTICMLVRDITGRKQAEELLARRAQEMQALHETSLEINAQRDVPLLLRSIVQRAAGLLGVKMGALYLMQPDGASLELVVSHNMPDRFAGIRLRLGEGLSGRVAETGQVLMVSDYQHWEGRAELYTDVPFRCVLGVPLQSRGRMIGVLNISDDVRTGSFDESEIGLARLFADQAALAIENARLLEETRRRADQVSALYQTAEDLTLVQDLSALLHTIVERAVRLCAATGGGMYLFDAERGDLQVAVTTHPSTPVGTRLQMGEGMAGRVAQTRAPLIVNDYQTWPGRSPHYEGTPIAAVVEVPMLYGGELVGVLVVEEVGETTHAFSEEDARFLALFAGQAASAVHNARLMTETRRRAERLALLNRIARVLSSTLKLDDLLEIVYREIASAMDAEAFFVALYDPATTELDFRIRVDAGVREPVQRRLLTPGLTSLVVTHKHPLLIRDYEHEKDHLPAAKVWGTMGAPQSWLGVPMLLGEKLVGVISVQAYRSNAYAQADQELLSTIADTVAVAIENARLFEETTRRAEQLARLREIDHAVSSMLDLPSVLEKMLTWLGQVVPHDSAAVLLCEGNLLRAAAAHGLGHADLLLYQLDVSNNAFFQEMTATREPVVIRDLNQHPDWVRKPGTEYARSWLGVPLFARGEVIGQLSIFGAETGQFNKEHGELVMALANHAAIAIANALLHAQLHEQARCDSLTQALNHGTFIDELRAACEQDGELAMIMLDLDNFKRYNDTYGHMVGDRVLKATVQAIRAHIKQTDWVGRWGGEEFGVALRHANADVARAVAERIRVTLAEMQITDRHGHPIASPTASQGIAVLPATAQNVDELIECADRALYRAKARGRGLIAQAGDEGM